MSIKRIRLKVDLPVEARHGCKAGNEYEVVDERRREPLVIGNKGRLEKVGFVATSGETVYAFPEEFERL